ncbi:hypothetical protein OJF2_79410 (plasmid) [Aquisphaera giovannonii]|uniref:Uncharacterized protein n=1 Tax=Aquisphaera giovannonii TaxID=406548 RepID=A0A5B9WFB8_9BACT|nr:hypothetical protein [Aquisphaera giovannonii]QEH39326.1 hypothetical protein OJF2_79410 [Aquisphaera giovannonii]
MLATLRAAAAAAIVAVSLAPLARGDILDFRPGPTTEGTVSYDGLGGPLVGSGITLGDVLYIDTQSHTTLWERPLFNTAVSFTTGDFEPIGNDNVSYFSAGARSQSRRPSTHRLLHKSCSPGR